MAFSDVLNTHELVKANMIQHRMDHVGATKEDSEELFAAATTMYTGWRLVTVLVNWDFCNGNVATVYVNTYWDGKLAT